MPELPEVETTRCGILPHVQGRQIVAVKVRRSDLRVALPASFATQITSKHVVDVRRRSKYLLVDLCDRSSILMHLGMSGSLRITLPEIALRPHDHVAFVFDSGYELRFHDSRRFGLILPLCPGEEHHHPLLASLGPEPFDPAFDGHQLHSALSRRHGAIKIAIMNAHVIVGVGNIYASEALFRAGIHPLTPACKLSRRRCHVLLQAIREVLAEAIAQGGTTLRDFVGSDGKPGYFRQQLFVYERAGEPCRRCGSIIEQIRLGQRSTYWCRRCQRR